MTIEFTPGFELASGPNGNTYVRDTQDKDRIISISAFLYGEMLPYTEEQKQALLGALNNKSA